MRTIEKYKNNIGYLLRDDGSKSKFYFNYGTKRNEVVTPFGQPLSAETSVIKTTTQLPFKADNSIIIKDNRSRIASVNKIPYLEHMNRRLHTSLWEYTIEIS